MNCMEVRKYLYAFADGELDTPENLDVLEHLNMCPTCTQKVNVQQELKTHLARVMLETPDSTAPQTMRASVFALIAAEAGGTESTRALDSEAADHGTMRVPSDAAGRHVQAGVRRYWIPGAIAAVVALSILSVWTWDRSVDPTNPYPGSSRVKYTDESDIAVTLANHVYKEHQHGCQLGPSHHDATLPKDIRLAAEALTERLDGCPMLRCDSLSDMPGAEFESANVCTLITADGREVKGGHIVLRLDDGERVSLISVPPLPEMAQLKKETFGGKRAYAVLHPDKRHTQGQPVTIVGFDCPQASHFVCAPRDPTVAVRIAEPMRLALQGDVPSVPTRAAAGMPYRLASTPTYP